MPINLHQHAVLEASAGTGKTYSIGELVLRLLRDEAVPLEKILIVTYTEKATGELKSRLRLALDKELASSASLGDYRHGLLRSAIDGFDQAWIFTLHGFCRRILQEYPLEQGQDVNSQLVHDQELLEPCLRELQRRTWRQEYGPFLGEVLQLSGYDRQQALAWEEQVRELADKIRPGSAQRLEPAAIADWPSSLAALTTKLLAAVPVLQTLMQQLQPSGREFIRAVAQIKDWFQDTATSLQPIKTFHDLIAKLGNRADFRQGGFRALLSQNNGQAGEDDAGLRIVTRLDELYRSADWTTFRHQLAVRTIPQLQDALDEYKKQHGLWSFQDMIGRVDDALDPAKNSRAGHLAALLRQRFHYGIVDEFQDTDPMQWRILRRIFLSGASSPRKQGTPLFLVGDPKQAIFGFRGADLPTYQEATRELLERHQAQDCPLRVNWRSTPELIEALNRLFQGDWFPSQSHIRYLPVEAAPEGDRPSKLVADRTGRPALNLVDWRQDQYLAKLRRRHADFIVGEISRLLAGGEDGPTMVSINHGEPRPLHAGDICVLVFRRREARPLLAGLRQAGIPYSFYKQAALWRSQEAVHLRLMLESLSQPEHRSAFYKALLTRFFRISPQELAQSEEIQSHHPARQLFQQWLDLASRRQWASLFQSMLEDTGLFFADLADTDADRRRANYRHLTSQLIQQAYRQNLDLLSLTEWFRRQENLGVVDEDVQPKETERPRVQIMTIHASKGLEYPVVFLAGGWTQRQTENLLVYRTPEHCQVYDVTNPPLGSPPRVAADRDRLDEQRRLLYVALTRAMFKLYVPYSLLDGSYWKSKGPIVQLLAPALNRIVGQTLGGMGREGVDWNDDPRPVDLSASAVAGVSVLRDSGSPEPFAPGCVAIIDPGPPNGRSKGKVGPDAPSQTSAAESCKPPAPPAWHIEGPLVPSVDADLSRRGIVIRSFSSLHRASKPDEEAAFATEPPRAEDEDVPADAAEADPLRGAVFGEIVHGVLEKIDYEAVGRTASPELLLADSSRTEKVLAGEIDQYLPQLSSRLPEGELRALCRQRVAELVWHALHTPLPELGPLWQIPLKDRLVEVSFHFPEHEAGPGPAQRDEGFLTGFIDLVLRRQGRYFLVDWKTNELAGYGPADVARAMDEGDYHLQYRLYLQALVRWLRRSLGPTFDFRRDIGGVYYLFLRGLGGPTPGDGIFLHRPTAQDLQLDFALAVRRGGQY